MEYGTQRTGRGNTNAKFYEEHEEEIRASFTKKHIECDTSGLIRKNHLRPRMVGGVSL